MRTAYCYLLASLLCLLLHVTPAAADAMAIPYLPTIQIPQLPRWQPQTERKDGAGYDPVRVRVYEPGQRAVILFNGCEEILCLSTEVYASEATAVLEIIPFPSEPTVQLGEFATMQAAEQLLLKYFEPPSVVIPPRAAPGGIAGEARPVQPVLTEQQRIARSARLTFHEKMGAHDVSVAEVLDTEYFTKWVHRFFLSKGAVNPAIREEYLAIVKDYLDRGCSWFVFDSLYLSDTVQSREPVEYRFACDYIYYPLQTSTQQAGHTTIDIMIITQKSTVIDWRRIKEVKDRIGVRVPQCELFVVSKPWAAFFDEWDISMQMFQIQGELGHLDRDLVIRPAKVAVSKKD